jgi:signal transduction histidine kinase
VSGLLAKTLRSSTFKHALLAIVVFGAFVIALFGYVYFSTAAFVRNQSDRTIAAEQAILRKAYDSEGRGGLIALIKQRIANIEGGYLYLLADPSFVPISGNLTVWPSALRGSKGWENFSAPESQSNRTSQPLLRAMFVTLPNGDHFLVGKEIDDLNEFTGEIKSALMWVGVLVFVLAGTASVLITRRTVGRIEAISSTSRAIMESGLGKRIPLRGTHDEWDQVAESLNLMLDRIETLMGEVIQVTDNVAHDLRTPLTRIRGRLEQAYHRQRDIDNDQSLIGDTIADVDAVLRIFSSLTRISQIEANVQMSAFRTVNLAETVGKIVELFDAAAEERGIRLSLIGNQQVLVTGDKDLLFDAVSNLVDNAIKHGRSAGQVTVEITNNDGEAVISVADDGPGIAADEYQNVFKRFYRLERSRHTPGNGLGLSLVEAVARLHRARIEMLDNKPGLKILLRFPAPAKPNVESRSAPEAARSLV